MDKLKVIPPQKNISVTKLIIATYVTTVTNVEPEMTVDRDLSVFLFPNTQVVRDAIAGYSMNLSIPVQDFERVYLRLRTLMYAVRPARR